MRFRRYRSFLLVAVIALVSIYHLSRVQHWDGESLEALVGLRHTPAAGSSVEQVSKPIPIPGHSAGPDTDQTLPQSPSIEPEHADTSRPADTPSSLSSTTPTPLPTVTGEEFLAKQPTFEQDFGDYGQGRYEVKTLPGGPGKAYWKQQKEHFPVPAQSLIALPTSAPNALPRIQHNFGQEASARKTERLRRQNIVREAFKHAWLGYKNYSMPDDELRPISRGSRNPFNAWGATLVDSLDSLWIMGLYDEFREAVAAVGKIDFKTSPRKDIPLFETTIRYLGGLVAAYDVSSGKYPVLLEKAVELADILMGAFDTPNRMPDTYYHWAPSYASQPNRAKVHTVLAELGSLSVEFTRLAQITKENRYYDAVARITDALQEWQMKTTLPGLWPLKLDASGCKKPTLIRNEALEKRSTSHHAGKRQAGAAASGGDAVPGKDPFKAPDGGKSITVTNIEWEDDYDSVDCEPQGLNTEPYAPSHVYGIGSMADSTYEYLPKEYALLGGQNPQYKTLYLDAMEVVRDQLLYRPMTKGEHDILFLAKKNVAAPTKGEPLPKDTTTYEGTHLGCYAGGMFALGAKMFDIPDDMDIAEKLTNGCVWAYGSTPVGVMAEDFELVPCESLHSCKWDETRWHEALDPNRKERMQAVEMYNLKQQQLYEEAQAQAEAMVDVADGQDDNGKVASAEEPHKEKRDTARVNAEKFVPRVALSHEKYVAARIQEERLPPGYTRIKAPSYILRPEAIESVFIMYRITGDESWQEKGWAMFEAVDRATRTETAHAAVKDVTSQFTELKDSMESFWLAETLKYYYLLFSDPQLISLDDYVL